MCKRIFVACAIFMLSQTVIAGPLFYGKISSVVITNNGSVNIVLKEVVPVVAGDAINCFYGNIFLGEKNGPADERMLSIAMMLYATQQKAYLQLGDNGVNGGQDCYAIQLGAVEG